TFSDNVATPATDNLEQNNSSPESADSESGCSDDEEIVVAIPIQCCYKNCPNAKTNFESFEFERYQRAHNQ
uniref:Uncharacterized protein n=1 Tax=Romanomermis culicivorax TaxID=13658 RepID=A0A915K232_ROMCU